MTEINASSNNPLRYLRFLNRRFRRSNTVFTIYLQKLPFKDNKETGFGVAWAYDLDHGGYTSFSSNEILFSNAADFGNFDAGYTGTYADVKADGSYGQYWWAGRGEVEKVHDGSDNDINRTSDQRLIEIHNSIIPYDDQIQDYNFNTHGMYKARLVFGISAINQYSFTGWSLRKERFTISVTVAGAFPICSSRFLTYTVKSINPIGFIRD